MDESFSGTLNWLLEPADIGVRYLALRDLTKADAKELQAAKNKAHQAGPIATVLSNMNNQGYWVHPGLSYLPKYTSTVWSIPKKQPNKWVTLRAWRVLNAA